MPLRNEYLHCKLLLAEYVRQRRQQLELTINDASELAGIAFSEWCALESGWIPQDRRVLHSTSGTLMTSLDQISLLAMIGLTEKGRPGVPKEDQ